MEGLAATRSSVQAAIAAVCDAAAGGRRNAERPTAQVVRNVLNSSRPLFREARFLLAEEPELRESALYHGVLAAIAEGNNTRGGIASFLGRKSTDLGHPLTVLEGVGMVACEQDAFHARRSTYRITEPLLTFYYAIMRSEWSDLERPGHATEVWERSGPPSQVEYSVRISSSCRAHGAGGTQHRAPWEAGARMCFPEFCPTPRVRPAISWTS
ncbi:AAA family ATPase [Nocardia sp. X0981]